jgi:hypothetical protein
MQMWGQPPSAVQAATPSVAAARFVPASILRPQRKSCALLKLSRLWTLVDHEVGPARSGTHSPCSCSLSRRRQPRDRRGEGSHNRPMRRFLNRSALFISSLPGLRLCLLAAKSTRWDPRRLSDLLSDLSIQQVAQPRQRATQMHQLQRVSILLLFQVP